jgi:hypothetical protein
MGLKYICDNWGNRIAVIIPIEEWNKIISAHRNLKELESDSKPASNRKPSDFIGILSEETAIKMQSDIKRDRK